MMNTKLFRLFALLIVFSLLVTPAFSRSSVLATPLDPAAPGQETYTLLFEGVSLTVKFGGAAHLDVKSAESQAYLKELAQVRGSLLAKAGHQLGRSLEVIHVYDVILNGVATRLSPAEAALLQKTPGIRAIIKDTLEQPDTDAGPTWIGAPALWSGEAVPDGIGSLGEGVLAGIIDTGINFDHPSFSDTPTDGFTYTWDGDYLGACATDPEYAAACNNKLVGAWTYTDETVTPEDMQGHGSHTASTVAGNVVEVSYSGVSTTISGVAPHAQIISYDVCDDDGCWGTDSAAAAQQAVLDGVDVINFSISGGEDPYNDLVELAFLEAFNADIFVSTSAGNEGYDIGPASVAHRSPWVSSVAAATHNRLFANRLDVTGPAAVDPGLVNLGGLAGSAVPISMDYLDLPIKYDPTNVEGCVAYTNPALFTDAIALVNRGTCTFVEKVNFAAAAGADFVVIYNNRAGPPILMDTTGVTIPAIMVTQNDGLAIKAWIDLHTDATASVYSQVNRITNPDWADMVADFSSYGPNTTIDVLKPDITAPGVDILAAVADGTIAPSSTYELELYLGTSMAAPHNAGSAALIMSLHPDWSPAQVRSALMMTAQDGLLVDRFVVEGAIRLANSFDEGSGRLSLEDAGLAGLVMDETYANFVAANPVTGGNPKALNLPSLYNSKCVDTCSWTRTFSSVADEEATYIVDAPDWITVAPANFTIPAGGTQEITIVADVVDTLTTWQFGSIYFNTEDTFTSGDSISDVHIPLAALAGVSNLPEAVIYETLVDDDSETISDIFSSIAITKLTIEKFGFVKGQLTEIDLAQDPTPSDPFDNLNQVYYTTFSMGGGASRFVAEITQSTAPDVDLFFGYDANNDGLPSADEVYAYSATGAALEYISLVNIASSPFAWWVLVQNWTGSGVPLDDITLSMAIVPKTAVNPVNMTVTGPTSVPATQLFDLQVGWSGISMLPGDRLYGMFSVYTAANKQTTVGSTLVDVIKVEELTNTAPTLTAIGPKSIDELAELTFIVNATDDGLPTGSLAFSLVGAPAAASINPVSGAFSWTPTEAEGPDDYIFDVCVSDGALQDCETITVSVMEVNVAPVLGAIGNQSVQEGALLTFTATASDQDLPGQTLVFGLAGAPTGAVIDPVSGAFSWTPGQDQVGDSTFDVCVGDGVVTDCETITVTVTPLFRMWMPIISN